MNEEGVALSTEVALSELMLSGCTTVSDHHYLFNASLSRAIDTQVQVAKNMGVRVVLTRGSMSLGVADGGLPPNSVVQKEEEILSDSERLIDLYHETGEGAMVQIALAPCSPFSVSQSLMQQTADLARNKGVLLHTHLAETEDENAFCLEKFGRRPLEYLEDVSWLADDVWLAHGIHFSETEIAKLGASGVGISHCPSSNMMLASGMAKVLELEQAGCPVGIGVDGSASNDVSNMMEELRQAFLLQRLNYGSAKVSHEDALRWATQGGAELFRRSDIGNLELGKCADVAVFTREELQFSGSHDALASLVLCGARQVDALMVGGAWKVKDGHLLDRDLARLKAEHSAAAKILAQRYLG